MRPEIRLWVAALGTAACCWCALAGTINPPGPPSSSSSAMYTLKQLHERLTTGTNTARRTTTFVESTAPPGGSGTGVTINDVVAVSPKQDTNSAKPYEVRTGKAYWSLGSGWLDGWVVDWGHLTGTGSAQLSPSSTTVSNGFYATTDLTTVDSDLTSGNIRSGVEIFGVTGNTNVVDTGSGTATSTDIRDGKIAWVNGTEITGSIQNKVLLPTTDNMPAGFYSGTTLSAVDSDLKGDNIITGAVIFGVQGTYDLTPIPAPVMKTGQTNTYQTADDGYYKAGAAERTPRFSTITTNGNEKIILDDVTGLTWVQNATTGGQKNWSNAVVYCESLNYGGYQDWRLPNVNELASIVDYQRYSPMAPGNSSPFYDVRASRYWTSTTDPQDTNSAYQIWMHDGRICSRGQYNFLKSNGTFWVWPVRGGN